MTSCVDCKFFLPWANRQNGECSVKLPPWVVIAVGRKPTVLMHPVVNVTDRCDLGVRR